MSGPGPRVLLVSSRGGLVELRQALLTALFERGVDVFESSSTAAIRDLAYADLVLLLVGDDYGEVRAGETRSGVHQVERAATQQYLKVVPILVEGAGALQGDGRAAAWKRSLQRRPDVLVAPRIRDAAAVANRVADHLGGVVRRGIDNAPSRLTTGRSPDAVDGELRGIAEVCGDVAPDVGRLGFGVRPVRREGAPLWNDAVTAVDAGMWREARSLLAAQLDAHAMDAEAGFWLARILQHLGSSRNLQDAIAQAHRAARVEGALGSGESHKARAAAGWLLAAGAARRLGWQRRADLYADHARALVPWRVEPIISEAIDAAAGGRWADARSSVVEAFLRDPNALSAVLASQPFVAHEVERGRLVTVVRREIAKHADQVFKAVAGLGASAQRTHTELGPLVAETRAVCLSGFEQIRARPAALWERGRAVEEAIAHRDALQEAYNEQVKAPIADPRSQTRPSYGAAERADMFRVAMPVLAVFILAFALAARIGTLVDVAWVAGAAVAVGLVFVAVDQVRQAWSLKEERAAQAAYDEAHRARGEELQASRLEIVAADEAIRTVREQLARDLSEFAAAVHLFEDVALAQPLFRPTAHPLQAVQGEVVAVDAEAVDPSWPCDPRLIPLALCELARMEPMEGGASRHLYRRRRVAGETSQARWAVWFDLDAIDRMPGDAETEARAVAERIAERMRAPVDERPAAPASAPVEEEYDFSEIARPREGAPHVYGPN